MNKNHLIYGFLLLVFGLMQVTEVKGQGKWRGFWNTTSAEYDEDNLIYIGIIFPQYSYSNYFLEIDPNYNTLTPVINGAQNQFNYITTQGGSSMGIGLPIRIRITDLFSITSGIKVMASEILNLTAKSIGQGPKIIYNYIDNQSIARMHRGDNNVAENFNTVEIPMHLRVYSNKNFFNQSSSLGYRLFLTAGTNYITHAGAKKYYDEPLTHENLEPPLIFKPSYWNFEGGLGFSIYTTYSKISLETRYTQSIGNILDLNRHADIQAAHLAAGNDFPNPYMDAISKLGIRGWQFSIILE